MKILKAIDISPDDLVVDLRVCRVQLRRDQRTLLFVAPIFIYLNGLMGSFRVPHHGEPHYGLYLSIFIMMLSMSAILFIAPVITIVRRDVRKHVESAKIK